VGGWIEPPSRQDYHDRIFRLQTADPYGITGWTIVKGYKGEDFYIDNTFENANSTDFPADVKYDRNDNPVIPYQSWHTIQPDVFPFENLPPGAGGVKYTCCDTIFYSYDYEGRFPEFHVGVHYAFITNDGVIQRAGTYGNKNP